MKAVRIHEFGGPEVLRYEDVPDPRPRQDQVLVRIKSLRPEPYRFVDTKRSARGEAAAHPRR